MGSRIQQKINEKPTAKVNVSGTFTEKERQQIEQVMPGAGYDNRSEFVHDAVMDAVEELEKKTGAQNPTPAATG
jgi:metal-responsive CopG/Arc/MetJ family transcriptional regulator